MDGWDDDENDDDIKASLDQLQRMLAAMNKTADQKRKEAKEDQQLMRRANTTSNLMNEKQLISLEKQKGKLPPYFENISKDVMINRKMKILIDKSTYYFIVQIFLQLARLAAILQMT